jgi:hypothetical protein
MPYIMMIRSDVPDGALQVVDLKPNTSQRNPIKDGPSQTKYLRAPDNEVPVTTGTGPIEVQSAVDGLAAYLIDNVEDQDNGGTALTGGSAGMAVSAAASLIATMQGGGAVTAAVVNAALQAATGGGATTIDGGTSTGSLGDVLEILSGAVYRVPAGTEVESAANAFSADPQGSFIFGTRHIAETGSLNASIGEGQLSGMLDANFSYFPVGGAAAVTGAAISVLADDGNLY